MLLADWPLSASRRMRKSLSLSPGRSRRPRSARAAEQCRRAFTADINAFCRTCPPRGARSKSVSLPGGSAACQRIAPERSSRNGWKQQSPGLSIDGRRGWRVLSIISVWHWEDGPAKASPAVCSCRSAMTRSSALSGARPADRRTSYPSPDRRIPGRLWQGGGMRSDRTAGLCRLVGARQRRRIGQLPSEAPAGGANQRVGGVGLTSQEKGWLALLRRWKHSIAAPDVRHARTPGRSRAAPTPPSVLPNSGTPGRTAPTPGHCPADWSRSRPPRSVHGRFPGS